MPFPELSHKVVVSRFKWCISKIVDFPDSIQMRLLLAYRSVSVVIISLVVRCRLPAAVAPYIDRLTLDVHRAIVKPAASIYNVPIIKVSLMQLDKGHTGHHVER
jgi:hypothetical protein